MPHGAACTCYPVTTRNSHDHRYHQTSLSRARDGKGRKKEKARTIKENGYACFKMENQFLILYYMPDVLVEIFAGT